MDPPEKGLDRDFTAGLFFDNLLEFVDGGGVQAAFWIGPSLL